MTDRARVLIVEDDPSLRRGCEAGLRQRGLDVISASEGEEGLRLARATPHPDVIVLDVLVPKVPGLEVLRALKAEAGTAAIPIVMLSNSARDEDRREALELGAEGYYVKANLSLRDLARRVDEIAGRTRRPRPASDATPDGETAE